MMAPRVLNASKLKKPGQGAKVQRARLDAVEAALRECLSHGLIESRFSRKWNLSRRTIKRYIHAVYRYWAAEKQARHPFIREEIDMLFRDFYRMHRRNDPRAAIIALDRLARLHGCYEPEKIQVDHNGSLSLDVNDPDAIRDRINTLLNKRRRDVTDEGDEIPDHLDA